MCKARFTKHQVITVIRSVEATYYNWKSEYDGKEASDIKEIKDLEDENRRLKQMFAGM